MAFRWDLLPQTSTTLQRDRAPVVADASAWYPVVWVYTAENLAWLLKDGTIQVLPPTSGNIGTVEGVTSTEFSDLESRVDNLQIEVDDFVATDLDGMIKSIPTSTQYKITELALDENKKVVVTHDDTPEA
jgi:hypothetical protein